MKWSKSRKGLGPKSPTQQRLLELASAMRIMRLHGQPTSQEMEIEYRELLAKNYEERAQA
jgi:hypothetical protein